MKHALTPIVLCADDYAQNPAIDTGILELLEKKRLTAVSCFSGSPNWQHAAHALLPYGGQTDIGLHFNLTEGFGKEATPGLYTVIVHSLLRRMNAAQLRHTILRQLDAFEDAIGHAPDFLDGHQHVHQLPCVREIILQVLKARYPERPLWIRNTLPAAVWRGKPQILKHLGGQALARCLHEADIPTNHGFAGVYSFNRPDYNACFHDWLEAARPGMLIMCHPAAAWHKQDDIAAQRVVEYHFLRSWDYIRLLEHHHVNLRKLSDCFLQSNDIGDSSPNPVTA